jgi:hypothetical protein
MSGRRSLTILMLGALLVSTLMGGDSGAAADPDVNPQQDVAMLEQFWLSTEGVPSAQPSLSITAFDRGLLAKAEPDECFNGPGVPYTGTVPLCEYGIPKVNQAYVWGLAKPGDDLWFGTAPNTHCLVLGAYLGITTTVQTASYVCEFGDSQYAPPLPPAAGDWRPPDLFVYDTQAMTLTEVTPADPLLTTTLGIRSAGTLDDVVVLGGPGLLGGINLFAFDAPTQAYLGSTNLPEYDNIRKWLVLDGVLYTGVRDAATGAGHVLRWAGDPVDPFQFEVVGNLGSEAVELAVHEGRLFVTTWPNLNATPPETASLYMSPLIPEGGLSAADADGWQRIWQAGDYEPDPVTAATYGGGALHSFDGYLYWGTMHVPFVASVAHLTVYGPPEDPLQTVAAILGTHRSISIFRGRDLGTADQEVELVYGRALLPVYVPPLGWLILPNNMGSTPLWGPSGFGNFYNNYTWTMEVYDDQLFVGTMDWSYLLDEGLPLILEYLGIPPDTPILLPEGEHGADLYRFSAVDAPAEAESLDGMGNPTNYGIRTMLSADDLYLGMANPMNLLTDPEDDLPEGGWELLRLLRPAGTTVYLPSILRQAGSSSMGASQDRP